MKIDSDEHFGGPTMKRNENKISQQSEKLVESLSSVNLIQFKSLSPKIWVWDSCVPSVLSKLHSPDQRKKNTRVSVVKAPLDCVEKDKKKTFWTLPVGLWAVITKFVAKFNAVSLLNFVMVNTIITPKSRYFEWMLQSNT